MRRIGFALAALALIGVAAWLWTDPGPESPVNEAPPVAEPVAEEAVDLAGRRGALVDQVVFTQESDVGKITALIESGAYQLFVQGITSPSIFRRLRDAEGAAHSFSYGTSAELSLNPAGPRFDDGRLNPFHVPAIREALNWLVDRRHIVEEIYGGLAVERFLPLNTAFPDYARLADVARALELRYRHDPQRARAVIAREMEALGARREGGRWMDAGSPVRIIVLIRTEDERRRVGDYVANLLEDEGFAVERLYRTAEEASRIWIANEPSTGGWHLYTGGWIATVISRDLAANLSFYYTPRGRPEPLWQAYDPDPELDDIADRLQRRDYDTWEERQALMARGIDLALRDSVRIWLVDQLNVWPRGRDVELAVDLAGGISGSALWPHTLRYRDRVGGQMVVATPSLLTEPWNPIAGSNWIFDQMIIRGLEDNPLLPDPFTGLFWPQRIDSAEVTLAGPRPVIRTHDWLTLETEPEIVVPGDSWIDWDARAGRFLTVAERHPDGLAARTRTVVRYEADYLERRWHDGSQLSLADIVLPWILSFERADEASRLHDPAHVPTFEVFRRHFRGWRIVDREPLVIEIYSDQIFPDAEWIVASRTPSPLPWHTLALGIRAELNGELAFSSNKADRIGAQWLSLVAGPSLGVLARHLEEARGLGHVPYADVLGPLIREGEAAARYEALARWYGARGHFWVSDGLFYLHSVHPVERSVVVRRFEDFPDPSDKWLGFTRPEIPELDLEGPMVVEAGESLELGLWIGYSGEPYPAEAIETARYLLFDGTGALRLQGEAQPEGAGRWSIRLAAGDLAALGTGANRLEVAVTSRRVALPAFASHAFATVPRRTGAGGG